MLEQERSQNIDCQKDMAYYGWAYYPSIPVPTLEILGAYWFVA